MAIPLFLMNLPWSKMTVKNRDRSFNVLHLDIPNQWNLIGYKKAFLYTGLIWSSLTTSFHYIPNYNSKQLALQTVKTNSCTRQLRLRKHLMFAWTPRTLEPPRESVLGLSVGGGPSINCRFVLTSRYNKGELQFWSICFFPTHADGAFFHSINQSFNRNTHSLTGWSFSCVLSKKNPDSSSISSKTPKTCFLVKQRIYFDGWICVFSCFFNPYAFNHIICSFPNTTYSSSSTVS